MIGIEHCFDTVESEKKHNLDSVDVNNVKALLKVENQFDFRRELRSVKFNDKELWIDILYVIKITCNKTLCRKIGINHVNFF